MERISVIIKDKKFIPTVGNGPILKPISITKNLYTLLTKLGFDVRVAGQEKLSIPVQPAKDVVLEQVIEPVDKEKTDEVVEGTEDAVVEDVVIGDVVEEDAVVEDVVEEDATESDQLDIDLMTKDDLKAALDAKGIKYKYNAKVEELKALLQA